MSKGAGVLPVPFLKNLIKNIMKNFILFLALLIILGNSTESKAQPYYYSSGVPTLFENWGNLPGGGGSHPLSFGENTEYIIESGKTAVLDFQWFIDNQATLRISGTLQVNHTLNMGPNTYLAIDSLGTIIYNSTTVARNTIFGGTEFFHLYSNFKITNWSSVNDAVTDSVKEHLYPLSQDLFGSLEIDWQGCNGNWFLTNRRHSYLCGNNLKITSTGAGKLVACVKNSSEQNGIDIKNFIQTDGEVDLSYSSSSLSFGAVFWIHGNFNKTAGILDATDNQTIGALIFGQNISLPRDTSTRHFYNSGTLRNVRIDIDNISFKLHTNLDLPIYNNDALTLRLISSTIDFGQYKISGQVPCSIGDCILKIASPEGFKNGASGGNFVVSGTKQIYYGNTIEYCGETAQITGDSLPTLLRYASLKINNPNGVTLSKDTWLDTNQSLKFVSGKLNLGNRNLKLGTPDSVQGVNENCFINTNGTGFVRIGLNGGYAAKFPVGNGSLSPAYISQAYVGNNDTLALRIENSFGSHMPFDTSRCVRKLWHLIDENPSVQTGFRFSVQFMKSDAGSNMNLNSPCAVGLYDDVYIGYFPSQAFNIDPVYMPPDSSQTKTINSYRSFSDGADNYFIAGNEEGVFETYFPDNTGDASLTGNWSSLNGGLHPPSFDRYALFLVPQGQTASFNNPSVFSDKAWIRSTGNGIINANASLTINGVLEINDSSTYNHNNTGVASQTCFAGREFCGRKSNFNILKWSDTTDKIFDENELSFGNLTINFNNLPEPFGANKYWTLFKNILPYSTNHIISGNLTYLNSSGYQFAPIGYGDNITSLTVYGNVQIGDSLNQTAFPVMNLSGGTTRAPNSTAGTLNICGNLDIQNGGLTSQDFPSVARGKIYFKREVNNIPQSHTFYSYNPFIWQTSNLGTIAFPNKIESDTLTLKSDMYNATNAAFLFTDAWQVESGAVLNTDKYRIRSLNLIVKNGGKLITKNADGFNADLANQNVTFEANSFLEFAGSTPQNFQKAGGYNLTNFPNIIINNSAGVIINTPGVSITNSVNFINGKVTSDITNYLTFPGSVQFNGASDNSFLNGPVKINTTAASIVTIPTGKGSTVRNVAITPTSSNSTDWIVEYFNQAQAFGPTLGTGINSVSQAEYFLINRSGASPSDARVGLYWGANSGVTNPSSLRVARWNDFQWEDKGNYSYTGNNSAGVIFSNVVTNFSPFAIASTDNQQLPVELSSFTASISTNNVTLNWITETEINNSGYEIERKLLMDTVWKKINFIQGAGNSHTMKAYKYEDRNLTTGKYKYRLKQIDHNGNYTYYNLQSEVNIGMPSKYSLSQNYPNPFNPVTKINYQLPVSSFVSLNVYDMTGREVTRLLNENKEAGYYTIIFDAKNLSSGTYFYKIVSGDFSEVMKMILVK